MIKINLKNLKFKILANECHISIRFDIQIIDMQKEINQYQNEGTKIRSFYTFFFAFFFVFN